MVDVGVSPQGRCFLQGFLRPCWAPVSGVAVIGRTSLVGMVGSCLVYLADPGCVVSRSFLIHFDQRPPVRLAVTDYCHVAGRAVTVRRYVTFTGVEPRPAQRGCWLGLEEVSMVHC
jgi:hypothetical protein